MNADKTIWLGSPGTDIDVSWKGWRDLQEEVMRLRRAIRTHRDATPEAARSLNDRQLYETLPDEQTIDGRTA